MLVVAIAHYCINSAIAPTSIPITVVWIRNGLALSYLACTSVCSILCLISLQTCIPNAHRTYVDQ